VPSITLSFTATGPLLTAFVGPSSPRQQALTAAGQQIPQATSGVFLVDTGASQTAVDKTLIVPLGLTPTGAGMFHTPSTGATPVPFPQYDVMLFIPGSKVGQAWIIEAMPVMECDLSAQGIQGLIGRDVLDRAIVVYNGPVNHFTVAY
jgi:hypothetical protein